MEPGLSLPSPPRRASRAAVLLMASAILLPGILHADASYPGARYLEGWRRIVLTGRKFLVARGRVTLTVSSTDWRPEPGSRVAALTPAVPAVVLGTESRMSLFGVQRATTVTESFLEEGTLRSLEFREVKEGRSTKRLQFLDDAYLQVRTRPPEGRPDAPRWQWETYNHEVKPYRLPGGEALPEGARPHDSYSLLYLVMQSPFADSPGGEEFVVVSKGNLLPVRLKAGRVRNNVRRVRDLATGRGRRLRLREREIHLVPLGDDPSQAGFLSMEGEIEIWVEAETRTILEVSGTIPGVGRTSLKLHSVESAEG